MENMVSSGKSILSSRSEGHSARLLLLVLCSLRHVFRSKEKPLLGFGMDSGAALVRAAVWTKGPHHNFFILSNF